MNTFYDKYFCKKKNVGRKKWRIKILKDFFWKKRRRKKIVSSQKFKLWQTPKVQIINKLKNSNYNQTQKLKLWPISKTEMVAKLKKKMKFRQKFICKEKLDTSTTDEMYSGSSLQFCVVLKPSPFFKLNAAYKKLKKINKKNGIVIFIFLLYVKTLSFNAIYHLISQLLWIEAPIRKKWKYHMLGCVA